MFGWICCTAFYSLGYGQIDRCHIFYFNLHPTQIIGIPRNSPVRKLVICRIHMINSCIIFICPICLWRDSHPPYPSIFVVVQNNPVFFLCQILIIRSTKCFFHFRFKICISNTWKLLFIGRNCK